MPNDFYNHGSFPTTGSAATSASMRAELDLIAAGFDRMPDLTGTQNRLIVVNDSSTGLTTTNLLSLTTAGFVGIGTFPNLPLTPLHVNANGGEIIRLSVNADGLTQQEPAIGFASRVADVNPAVKISALEFDASDRRASLLFYTRETDSDVVPTERMRIDSAGRVGIGSSALTGYQLRVSLNATGSISTYPIYANPAVQSDVTTQCNVFSTSPSVQNAVFTLSNLRHFQATQGTKGASATVTKQMGFEASSTLVGAVSNYGFYSDLDAAAGRWNFYANGTAENYFGGNTVISVTDNTNAALRITQLGTGNALVVEDDTNPDSTPFVINSVGKVINGALQSYPTVVSNSASEPSFQTHGTSSTGNGIGLYAWNASNPYYTFSKAGTGGIGTYAAVSSGNTLGIIQFNGADGTNFVGAAAIFGSADGAFTLDNAPGRLVFSTRPSGTAESITERMRIASTGQFTFTAEDMIAANPSAFAFNSTGKAAQTGNTVGVISSVSTDATYVGDSLVSVYANQGTLTVAPISQYGFYVPSTFIGATTNNYGFYSNIAAAANRWNFYANGTANNHFAGNISIGLTAAPEAKIDVQSGTQFNPSLARTTTNLLARATGTAGALAYGSAITFAQINSSRPWGAIAGVQYQADVDQGGMAFFVHSGTASNDIVSFAMIIEGTGNVGIGTNTPNTLLHLAGADTAIIRLENTGSLTTNQIIGGLEFEKADGSGAGAGVVGGLRMYSEDSTGASTYLALSTSSSTANNVERMRITSVGNIGFGGVGSSNVSFYNQKAISGGTTAYANYTVSTVQSDVAGISSIAYGHRTALTTAAAAFTLNSLTHYAASQTTLGAGSTVTNQIGFHAQTSLVGAISNYGFVSDIAAAANRWNFYANGTADNYFAGKVGIGTNSPSFGLDISSSSRADSSISLTCTDAGALAGPYIELFRISASPANNDVLGAIYFDGANSAAALVTYAAIESVIGTVTSAAEDGILLFKTTLNGTYAERMRIHSNGFIGIGVTTPACALDVVGGIQTSRTAVTSPATTDGNVFSGTYLAASIALTNGTNVTASAASDCQFMRVGNTVTISGTITGITTTAAGNSLVSMSIPVASNFGAVANAAGSGCFYSTTLRSTAVAAYADATNDRITFNFNASGASTSQSFSFTVTYKVI